MFFRNLSQDVVSTFGGEQASLAGITVLHVGGQYERAKF